MKTRISKYKKFPKYNFLILLLIHFLSLYTCKYSGEDQKGIKDDGFHTIFNGEDLDGWHGDLKYWRVDKGILIGEVTPETLLKSNSFIIYKKVQPENFELKLEYKISEYGNSGINYRSEIIDKSPFALRGYQCDIDGQNRYTGQNYEEKKRTTLAYIGEKVIIPSLTDSVLISNLRKNVKNNCWQTRSVEDNLGDITQLKSHIKANKWNSIHLKVNGNKMQHYVNGVLMSEVTDMDSFNSSSKGYIGAQVHVGPPMKIEFRDIKLKLLK